MQHTTPPAGTALARRKLAALLLGCSAIAWAGPPGATTGAALADPTRPPAALMTPAPLRGAATALPASAAATAATGTRGLAVAVPAVLAASVLQSVQLPLRGPAVAMVDGRLVKTGDTVGTRTVLSIDSQGLVLRGNSGGTERLSLLAGSAKQAPGSITTASTASFVAAPALDAAPLAPTERHPAGVPQPPNGSTLSLVGRIKP